MRWATVAVLHVCLLPLTMALPLLQSHRNSLSEHLENCLEVDLAQIEELKVNFQELTFNRRLNFSVPYFGLLEEDWQRLLELQNNLPEGSILKDKLIHAFRLLITALFQAHRTLIFVNEHHEEDFKINDTSKSDAHNYDQFDQENKNLKLSTVLSGGIDDRDYVTMTVSSFETDPNKPIYVDNEPEESDHITVMIPFYNNTVLPSDWPRQETATETYETQNEYDDHLTTVDSLSDESDGTSIVTYPKNGITHVVTEGLDSTSDISKEDNNESNSSHKYQSIYSFATQSQSGMDSKIIYLTTEETLSTITRDSNIPSSSSDKINRISTIDYSAPATTPINDYSAPKLSPTIYNSTFTESTITPDTYLAPNESLTLPKELTTRSESSAPVITRASNTSKSFNTESATLSNEPTSTYITDYSASEITTTTNTRTFSDPITGLDASLVPNESSKAPEELTISTAFSTTNVPRAYSNTFNTKSTNFSSALTNVPIIEYSASKIAPTPHIIPFSEPTTPGTYIDPSESLQVFKEFTTRSVSSTPEVPIDSIESFNINQTDISSAPETTPTTDYISYDIYTNSFSESSTSLDAYPFPSERNITNELKTLNLSFTPHVPKAFDKFKTPIEESIARPSTTTTVPSSDYSPSNKDPKIYTSSFTEPRTSPDSSLGPSKSSNVINELSTISVFMTHNSSMDSSTSKIPIKKPTTHSTSTIEEATEVSMKGFIVLYNNSTTTHKSVIDKSDIPNDENETTSNLFITNKLEPNAFGSQADSTNRPKPFEGSAKEHPFLPTTSTNTQFGNFSRTQGIDTTDVELTTLSLDTNNKPQYKFSTVTAVKPKIHENVHTLISTTERQSTVTDRDIFSTVSIPSDLRNLSEYDKSAESAMSSFKTYTVLFPKITTKSTKITYLNPLVIYPHMQDNFRFLQRKFKNKCRHSNNCVRAERIEYKDYKGIQSLNSG